jgi:16S rRNA (guanine(966)-N(2))-methyltransferase RsmD
MRITGGVLGGRVIPVPKGAVRPTQDRVRSALFSMLADRILGARFLDLFAGSGAVGIEAWSRGAEHVCWVESSPRVLRTLRETVSRLCDSRARVVGWDAVKYLKEGTADHPFDIVFADPPYAQGTRTPAGGWLPRLLNALTSSTLMAGDGIFVMEQSSREPVPPLPAWRVLADRRYGDAGILVLSPSSTQ